MKNKKIQATTILIFCIVFLYSQPFQVQYLNCQGCTSLNHNNIGTTFVYDANPTVFQTTHTASDYGPRDHGSDHYDWHGGVDYSSEGGNEDFGDGIIAIRGGEIAQIGNRRYKYIFIDGTDMVNLNGTMVDYDFGYGHLFTSPMNNQKSGNFYWQTLMNSSNDYAIIINDSIALYEDANSFVIHPMSGDTIQTTNQINAGEVIGPIGNSITGGRVSAHLHLYLFENNQFGTRDATTKNPLQFVTHAIPNYNVQLFKAVVGNDPSHTHGSSPNITNHSSWERFNTHSTNEGIKLTYPGRQSSQIAIRVKMDSVANGNSYANAIMNTDKVELLIEDQTASLIKGPYFESNFRLDGRVNINESRYPIDLVTRGQGQNGRTGIQPWAYSDRRQRPWDVYHFADFATRIHQDDLLGQGGNTNRFADLPDHARYNDGLYNIYAKVINAQGNESFSNAHSFVLDNFLPYIKQVRTFISGDLVYEREWVSVDDSSATIGNGFIQSPDFSDGATGLTTNISVQVISSEPLEFIQLTIPNLATNVIEGVPMDNSQQRWLFTYPANIAVAADSCYQMQFFGEDLSANALLNLSGMSTGDLDTAQLHIPIRQNENEDSTTWLPSNYYIGIDEVHQFCVIATCSDSLINNEDGLSRSLSNCIHQSDIEVAITNVQSGNTTGSIHLTLDSAIDEDGISFLWKNGAGEEISEEKDLLNYPPGFYCFEAKDLSCCKVSGCYQIKNCGSIIDTILSDGACAGNEGALSVILHDGLTFPFNFAWDNGATGQILYNLPSGTYCVTVTDGGGCTDVACQEVGNRFSLTADVRNICNGEGYGSIDLNILDDELGTTYYYEWNLQGEFDDEFGANLDSLEAGTYCVTVSDEFGCNVEECYTITEIENDLNINLEEMTCICSGGYGEIDISVNGGAAPYTYVWTGPNNFGASQEDISNLTVTGEYEVNVFDSNGCSISFPFVISDCMFNATNINTTITNSCTSPNSGSIIASLDPEGTTSPYIFIWTQLDGTHILGETSQSGFSTVENLSPGEYCLNVLTTNGCMATTCGLVITGFDPINYTYTLTPESLPGAGDGAIDLMINTDYNDLTFDWNTGASTEDLQNISAGTYEVFIDFAGGNCFEHLEITVPNCSEAATDLSLNASIQYLSPQGNDGAIDLTIVNGETLDWTYQWTSNNTGTQYDTQDLQDLPPDTYCVVASLAQCDLQLSGCWEICDFGLAITYESLEACEGTTVYARVNNEADPFVYLWTNGSTSNSTNIPYDEEHCVTVTDQSGCMATRCITIPAPSINLLFTTTDATLGSNNGAATVIPSGGVLPYTYQWSNFATFPSLNNLSAGTYGITVTDACGNSAESEVTVECEIGQDQVAVSISPVSCGSAQTGAIDLEILFQETNPSNTFQWSNGATTEDVAGLSAGEHCVTITNGATSCVYTNCYEVPTKGKGTFSLSITPDYPCQGNENGSLTVHPYGGIPPYSYHWNGGTWGGASITGVEQTLSNIPSGWYFVEVTDDLGCSVSTYTLLWGLPAFDAAIELSPSIVCFGEATTATAIPTGGTAPYTYSWSQCFPCEAVGTTEQIALESGLYIVTITDASGCQIEKGFSVEASFGMNIESQITHHCGDQEGSITLNVSGGSPPYEYQWNTGSNTSQLSSLSEGEYTVTVRDGQGCTQSEMYEVEASANPAVAADISEPRCESLNNGSISLSPIGEDTPYYYYYEWHTGQTSSTLYNLSSGTYAVTITNAYGCTQTASYTLSAAYDLAITIDQVVGPQYQEGEEFPTGSIKITATGGFPPYNYAWSGPNSYSSTNEDINGLYSGTYTLTVTDAVGCVITQMVNVCQNTPVMTALVEPFTTEPCVGGSGSITGLRVNGGTPPFSYLWSGPDGFSATTSELEDLNVSGTYCVTVTDQCHQSATTCQELSCDCDVDITAVLVDACDENPTSSGDDGAIKIYSIQPSNTYYHIQLRPESGGYLLDAIYYIAEDGNNNISFIDEAGNSSSSLYVEHLEQGLHYLTVEAANGCLGQEFYTVYGGNTCYTQLGLITNLESHPAGVAEYPTTYYINRCDLFFPCDSDNNSFSFLQYIPFDDAAPCTGGGYLRCSNCEGFFQIVVPENGLGIAYEDNGNCACLFPPGIYYDADFYEATAHLGNNIYDLPVLATYDCNGSIDVNPPDSIANPTVFDYDCPCEVSECILIPTDNCSYEVACQHNPSVTINEIFAGQTFCYRSNQQRVQVYAECNINPCDVLLLAECFDEPFGATCNESFLNNLLLDNGYLGELIYCEDINNCYPNIESHLPPCSFCPNIDLAFTDTIGNSDHQYFRTIDWLKSFDLLEPTVVEDLNIAPLMMEVSPNPFSQALNVGIYLGKPSEIKLTMIDLLGKRVWMKEFDLDTGLNRLTIPKLRGLLPGIYQIFLQDDQGNTLVEKVVYQP